MVYVKYICISNIVQIYISVVDIHMTYPKCMRSSSKFSINLVTKAQPQNSLQVKMNHDYSLDTEYVPFLQHPHCLEIISLYFIFKLCTSKWLPTVRSAKELEMTSSVVVCPLWRPFEFFTVSLIHTISIKVSYSFNQYYCVSQFLIP